MDNQAGVARARAKDTREAWAEVVPSAWDLIPIADLYSRVLYEKLQPTNSFPPNRTHLITSLAFFLPRHSSTLTPYSPKTTMAPIKILIINPNTNQSMTDSLRDPIESLGYNNVQPPPPTHPTHHTHPPPKSTPLPRSPSPNYTLKTNTPTRQPTPTTPPPQAPTASTPSPTPPSQPRTPSPPSSPTSPPTTPSSSPATPRTRSSPSSNSAPRRPCSASWTRASRRRCRCCGGVSGSGS